MSFTLDRTTTASVQETLHAIQHSGTYWRESLVPPELKRQGALGVNADMHGRQFRLFVYDMGRDPPSTFTDMKGRVEDAPGGGARVVARVGMARSPWRYIPFAVVAGLGLLTRSWWAALLLTGILIIVVALDRARDEGITERDDGARHLVERLDSALAALSPPVVASRDAAQPTEVE